MTDKEILQAAIEKAGIKNTSTEIFRITGEVYINTGNHYCLIFSHEFAEAFWNRNDISSGCVPNGLVQTIGKPDWQYHLQIMVLEENPIQYLKRFL